jgi:hypothetical protein
LPVGNVREVASHFSDALFTGAYSAGNASTVTFLSGEHPRPAKSSIDLNSRTHGAQFAAMTPIAEIS